MKKQINGTRTNTAATKHRQILHMRTPAGWSVKQQNVKRCPGKQTAGKQTNATHVALLHAQYMKQ